MRTEEEIGSVLLALDLYRLSLTKQLKEADMSMYGFLIDTGDLLINGMHQMFEAMRQEAMAAAQYENEVAS